MCSSDNKGHEYEDSDITILEKEDARSVLDRQLTSHQHIQKQAQSVIRLILAIIPIILTIFITRNRTISLQIPGDSARQEAATGLISEVLLGISQGLVFIIIMFLGIMALLYFTSGLMALLQLISPVRLYPGLGARDDQKIVVGDSQQSILDLLDDMQRPSFSKLKGAESKESYTKWIRKNQEILNQEHRRFIYGEIQILWMLFALVFASGFWVSLYSLDFGNALILALVIVLAPLVLAVAVVWQTWKTLNEPEYEGISESFSEVIGRLRPDQSVASGTLLSLNFLFYIIIYMFSAYLLYIWGQQVYYPQLSEFLNRFF